MAPTENAPAEDLIGKCIKDKYVIRKQIGQGGFGRVYLSENKYNSGQRFAIKVIPVPKAGRHHSVDPKAEIEIHRALAEKNARRFVKILDDFELEDGNVYIVMEYCAEGSLKDYVTRNREPMDVLMATDVLKQLVDALKLMHTNKIMHRDLTASNVLIKEIVRGQDGQAKRLLVKITDFGLSKRDVQGQLRTMLGTPAFMAPEVRAGKYTMAADVYSLGSIFYLLLTRKYMPGIQQPPQMPGKHGPLGHLNHQPPQQQQHLDLKRVWELNPSVRALYPTEDEFRNGHLKAFLMGLLCREDNRILLDEIDKSNFITWYRANRKVLDPEMDELCHSTASFSGGLGTPVGGGAAVRRLSRSGGDRGGEQPLQQQRSRGAPGGDRDSALGSDNGPSRSGHSSRCRHVNLDPETGRCRACGFRGLFRARDTGPIPQPQFGGSDNVVQQNHRRWPSTSSSSNLAMADQQQHQFRNINSDTAGGTFPSLPNDRRRPILHELGAKPAFNSAGNVQPATTAGGGRLALTGPPKIDRPQAYSAPGGKENSANAARTSTPKKAPWWPLPTVQHLQDYEAVNQWGRCSFRVPVSDSPTKLQLSAIFERTRSERDPTIEWVVELWRNLEGGQELRLFKPLHEHVRCPAKRDPFVEKNVRTMIRIGSPSELANHRSTYDTLCGFYRLAESKIFQACCDEVVDLLDGTKWKWRLELLWNGYLDVYGGARKSELKLYARQKAENGPFEAAKGADSLSKADRARFEELGRLLRDEVKRSVWRGAAFERESGPGHRRNIKCTIVSRGYAC